MIEKFYQSELKEEFGYTKYDYRNKTQKMSIAPRKIKNSTDEIETNVPRDRNSKYELQTIKI